MSEWEEVDGKGLGMTYLSYESAVMRMKRYRRTLKEIRRLGVTGRDLCDTACEMLDEAEKALEEE